jgi:hypothetical protein
MGRAIRVTVAAAVVLGVVCAVALAQPQNKFQMNLGVYLSASNDGVCAVIPPATVRQCTLVQADRRAEHLYGSGERPTVPGHIVLYRLRRGRPNSHTTAIEARFHVIAGPLGPGGAVGPWEELPLEGPRTQEFPVAVPFLPSQRIGLDVVVHGDGLGEAAAPLAAVEEEGNSTIAEWTPLLSGAQRPPEVHRDSILSLNAVFERDDRVGPRLRVSYSPRQDFLRTGRVTVEVHSDSAGILNPECSLLSGEAQWGLLFNNRHLRPGGWVRFTCHFYGAPLRAALKKIRRGGHPLVMVHPIAYDRAGNRGAEPKIYIRPL